MDTAGEGFFAAFDGPARAVRCAQAIVEAVQLLDIFECRLCCARFRTFSYTSPCDPLTPHHDTIDDVVPVALVYRLPLCWQGARA
jgi:hypothetical protein